MRLHRLIGIRARKQSFVVVIYLLHKTVYNLQENISINCESLAPQIFCTMQY